jgi:hypothetical protein
VPVVRRHVHSECRWHRDYLLAHLAPGARLASHRWRRRLCPDQHPVQLPEIAVIEKPTDHARRDLLGAGRVKLMSGREPTSYARHDSHV